MSLVRRPLDCQAQTDATTTATPDDDQERRPHPGREWLGALIQESAQRGGHSATLPSPGMKVLIDAVHPADVWTLGAVEDRLLANGEETLWLSRPGKDSVVELIEARGRPHVRASTAGTSMLRARPRAAGARLAGVANRRAASGPMSS